MKRRNCLAALLAVLLLLTLAACREGDLERPEDEAEWEMRGSLPPEFFEAHGDRFYLGRYNPETEGAEVYRSTAYLPGKPGTFEEGNVHIIQSFGMAPGRWYAILRPASQ